MYLKIFSYHFIQPLGPTWLKDGVQFKNDMFSIFDHMWFAHIETGIQKKIEIERNTSKFSDTKNMVHKLSNDLST